MSGTKWTNTFFISIHAPHTGRDATENADCTTNKQFQSTRPIRGATSDSGSRIHFCFTYFNPRAPYGARPRVPASSLISILYFNPRAPYGARLSLFRRPEPKKTYFNPRAPYGARPYQRSIDFLGRVISIHAPHTGRDKKPRSDRGRPGYFNPRAPYGARLLRRILSRGISTFQSTRPIRGATQFGRAKKGAARIHFNPRAPYGARPISTKSTTNNLYFNPRAPYGARHASSTDVTSP